MYVSWIINFGVDQINNRETHQLFRGLSILNGLRSIIKESLV